MDTIRRTCRMLFAVVLGAPTMIACVDRDPPTSPRKGSSRADVQALATRLVTTTADAGPGSLREAITQAQEGDVVRFDPSLAGATITLESQLVVDKSITIDGPLPNGVSVSGGNKTRVLRVQGDGINIGVYRLRIMEGNVLNDADPEDNNGGGVMVSGNALLSLIYSSVVSSTAARGGGVYVDDGSAIAIENSTIGGDQASYYGGGIAVSNFGSAYLMNSSVLRNTTFYDAGAGIWVDGDLELDYTTVAFNNSYVGAAGIHFPDARTVVMRYSIVSNNTYSNTTSANCSVFYGVPAEALMNLANDNSCGAFVAIVTDPMLGGAPPNDGTSIALPFGSPALDRIVPAPNSFCPSEFSTMTDQRGVLRPQHGKCDIGAYERIPTPKELIDELVALSASTPGVSTGTQSKLLDARDKLLKGQKKPACSSLKNYIDDIQAQRGKKIAVADADALIALATELRTLIGC